MYCSCYIASYIGIYTACVCSGILLLSEFLPVHVLLHVCRNGDLVIEVISDKLFLLSRKF